MKFKMAAIALVVSVLGLQAQALNLGVERTYECTANQESTLVKVIMTYSSNIYRLPAVGIEKASLPLKPAWSESNTVIGLDQREILNSRVYSEAGSFVELSALAEEMKQDTANVVIRVSGVGISSYFCKLISHKELSEKDLFP